MANHLQEFEVILSEYGFIHGKYRCSLLPSGTANQNYIVHKGSEYYILRLRNPKYSSEEWMEFEEEYLCYLKSKEVPVPTPVKNERGKSWIHSDGKVYQLYDYIDGSPFEKDNLEQIEQAGFFLGRLHRALDRFSPYHKKDLPRYDDPLNIINAVNQTFSGIAFEVREAEKRTLDFVLNTAEHILTVIPDSKYHQLHSLCIHGDYHPANVKYQDNAVCGLFDFDWISVQPRLRDIADGIAYFSAIRQEEFDGSDIFSLTQSCSFDLSRIKLFVNAYRSTCGRPLDEEEIKALPFFIKSRLLHSRVEALSKIPESRRVEMLTNGVMGPLKWLDENCDIFIQCLQ